MQRAQHFQSPRLQDEQAASAPPARARRTESPVEQLNADWFGGMSWAQRAALQGLRATIDPTDEVGRKNRYVDRLQQHAVAQELRRRKRPINRLVDFGCGTGRFFQLLTKYAREIYGIDRTPAMLEQAEQEKVVPASRLVLWRGGDLPFAPGYFDCFLTVSVLCVMSAAYRRRSLHALRLLCADDGFGIILEQGYLSVRARIDEIAADVRSAGFRITRMRPVRFGGGWAPMWLIRNLDLPAPLMDALIRLEMLAARRRSSPDPGKYLDYVLVVEPAT